MNWRKRPRNRWFWWQVAGLAVVLVGMGLAVKRTGDSPAITVPPDARRLDFGATGSSWTPEMQRAMETRLAVERALSEVRQVEIQRLLAEGKIEWRKLPPGEGRPPPFNYDYVVVATGEVYHFDP